SDGVDRLAGAVATAGHPDPWRRWPAARAAGPHRRAVGAAGGDAGSARHHRGMNEGRRSARRRIRKEARAMTDETGKKSGTVSLADEEAVREILSTSVMGLWDVVNTLARLRPSRRERYRVAI